MNALLAQLLNGLDKGGAYALIALGFVILCILFATVGNPAEHTCNAVSKTVEQSLYGTHRCGIFGVYTDGGR